MKTGNFVRLFSILALLLFSSSRLASAPTTDPTYQQVPLTWGTGYLANETILAGQASHLEFSYLGTAASFGYWLATTPTPDVPEYSVSIANNGDLTLRAGENIIGVLPAAVQVGDIIALDRTESGHLHLLVNEVLLFSPQTFALNLPLYPFLNYSVASQKDQLALFVADLAFYSADWDLVNTITSGKHYVAAQVLERGQDGFVEYPYAGESRVDLGFYRGKNPLPSNALARALYKHADNRLTFFINGNAVSYNDIFLKSGDDIRIERRGANITFYAASLKLTYQFDANWDFHPSIKKAGGIDETKLRLSFERAGGGCPDYFLYTTPLYTRDQSAYYPTADVDDGRNYTYVKLYNGQGENTCHVTQESRSYFDDLGRSVQTQDKDYLHRKVWASESRYDAENRLVLQSLAAPTGKEFIQYHPDFIQDEQGNPYGDNNFTGPSKLNNPDPVGPQVNTLGWWYSTNNVEAPWQAITDYPYARTEYSSLTGAARRSAGAGDAFRMGNGHEVVSYQMEAHQEMDYLFRGRQPMCLLSGSGYDVGGRISSQCTGSTDSRYVKQVSVDPDGKTAVAFMDSDGREVARALSGKVDGLNLHQQALSIGIPAQSYRDIHVTDEGSSIQLLGTGLLIYRIVDLSTDLQIYPSLPAQNGNASSQSLPPGFYRIINNANAVAMTLNYQLNYHNFSLNIYNTKGQMIATVAPNDVRHTTNPSVSHYAYSLYRYNSAGELLWEETPDAGRTEYHYRRDGQLRFSQNAIQLAAGRFSYTKYDALARAIESGECSSLPASLSDPLLIADASYPSSATSQSTHTVYDRPVTGSDRTQRFVRGRLSHTYNADSKIWYSYDEEGRLDWVAHRIEGNGTKYTDYQYDLLGNITEVAYEAGGGADEFHHYYGYDGNGQLTSVATKHNTQVSIPADLQAQYHYTISGALDRLDLADGLEQQQFAYTLQGQLKAINPRDISEPSTSLGGNHTFSLALDYYTGDYEAANGTTAGRTENLYSSLNAQENHSGHLAAQRWKSRADVGTADYSGSFAYAYTYNHRNELLTARFGRVLATSSNGYTGAYSPLADYFVNIGGYDLNGNFKQSLVRRGPANGRLDKLRYRYDKTGGKNRLTHIDDVWADFPGGNDLTDQAPNNYTYDVRGQLTEDIQEDLRIEYDVYGRVKKVYERSTNDLKVTYLYDATGQRIGKEVATANPGEVLATYYARAAGGQLQAIYEVLVSSSPGGQGSGGSGNGSGLGLKELPIYGGGRLGIARYSGTGFGYEYELSDHLGNVRAVITRNIQELKQVLESRD